MEFYDFPETVGNNNPIWRTPSVFTGVGQPPSSDGLDQLASGNVYIAMERSTISLLGKSTISTGPFSMSQTVDITIENVDFPMKNGDFPCFFVCLPGQG